MNVKDRVSYWYYCVVPTLFPVYWNLRAKFRSIVPKHVSAKQFQWAKNAGCVIDAYDRERATNQTQCNHRKGGSVPMQGDSAEIKFGLDHGNATQYAVIKHMHLHGDVWVECLRCGRKWKPPIRSEYETEREFYKAIEEYQKAVDFPTNNVTSSSLQFRFALGKNVPAGNEYVRKQLANS